MKEMHSKNSENIWKIDLKGAKKGQSHNYPSINPCISMFCECYPIITRLLVWCFYVYLITFETPTSLSYLIFCFLITIFRFSVGGKLGGVLLCIYNCLDVIRQNTFFIYI